VEIWSLSLIPDHYPPDDLGVHSKHYHNLCRSIPNIIIVFAMDVLTTLSSLIFGSSEPATCTLSEREEEDTLCVPPVDEERNGGNGGNAYCVIA
jgi:hypothetical protein